MQPISHEQDPALLVPPEDRDDDKPDGAASIYEWVEAAVFSLIVVVLVFTFLFRIVGVDGRSMQTTLMDKDRLILSALPYTPERGDIVVINRYTKEPLVKRIIAVENDTISIDEESHRVILNGEILDEPYIQGADLSGGTDRHGYGSGRQGIRHGGQSDRVAGQPRPRFHRRARYHGKGRIPHLPL